MIRAGLAATAVGGVLASLAVRGVGHTGVTARVVLRADPVVRIPAGEFVMGSVSDDLRRAVQFCQRDPLWASAEVVATCMGIPREYARNLCQAGLFTDEVVAHRVWLRAFGIDRTEVTVRAYDHCVAVGQCPPAVVTPGTPQLGEADHPVVGVTWDDALAFCRGAGGRLPTEAEWERAARGRDGRTFPWGNQFDPRRANVGALVEGCYALRDGHALTAPVGSYPDGASPDGVLDMAGNAAEWTADLYDDADSRYPTDPGVRLVDPRGSPHGAAHVVRGGAYDLPAFAMRTTYRAAAGTGARSLAIGFRCAYDLDR